MQKCSFHGSVGCTTVQDEFESALHWAEVIQGIVWGDGGCLGCENYFAQVINHPPLSFHERRWLRASWIRGK